MRKGGDERIARVHVGDTNPAGAAKQSMVAAGEEFGALVQHGSEGALRRRPVVEDARANEPATFSAEDLIADPYVGDRLPVAVAHQDGSIGAGAVRATMRTS